MLLRSSINPAFLKPKTLWEFVQQARTRRNDLVASLDRSNSRYLGPLMYAENDEGGVDSHEFEVCSLFTPQLVFDSPRCRVTSARKGLPRVAARAMQHGLNRWARMSTVENTLEALAFMFLMRTGRAQLSCEHNPSFGMAKSYRGRNVRVKRPVARAISPRRTLDDPLATCDEEALFKGHEYVESIASLVARAEIEEGWNKGAIARLKPDAGLEGLRPNGRTVDGPTRDDVGIGELWVPLQRDPLAGTKGYHGMLFTLSLAAPLNGNWEDALLRAPRAAYCPDFGPYVDFGAYFVLDDNTRLSPIVAVLSQVAHREKHEKLASKRAGRNKRIAAIDALSQESGRRLNAAQDGEVVVVDGVDKAHLIEMELGGLTETQMAYLTYLRQKLDRSSSMDDSQRGSVTGVGTARENEIAFAVTNTRLSYLKRRFAKASSQLFRGAGHYLFHEERVVMPFDAAGAKEMGQVAAMLQAAGIVVPSATGQVIAPPEPWFMGGVFPAVGVSYPDLEVDIDVDSMGRVSEGAAAGQFELLNWLLNLAPAMPALPHMHLAEVLDLAGDLHNFPRLKELVNYEVLQQMPPPEEPRYASEVGASPRPVPGGGARYAGLAGGGARQPARPLAPFGGGGSKAGNGPASPSKASKPSGPSGPSSPRSARPARGATSMGGNMKKAS